MLMPSDDNVLALNAARGDREAFGRLLERHYDTVYRVAYRYCGSAPDAEDIAQDICISLPAKLSRFGNKSRFTTWLYSVTLNACRDFSRRRKSSCGLAERYVVFRNTEDANQANSDRRSAWLRDALARLEPAMRETVLLVIDEELSHSEAAEVLGCAESTVSWRMHKAKQQLREQMEYADE